MAGYMTRVVGADAIYEGGLKAGEALESGMFVSIVSGELKKLTAAGDITMRVAAKESLWGHDAVRLDVLAQGAGTIYFVETVNDGTAEEYDDTVGAVKQGEFARAHKPLTGEQIIMTVDSTTFAALSVGDTAKPASGGGIAKQS